MSDKQQTQLYFWGGMLLFLLGIGHANPVGILGGIASVVYALVRQGP